MLLGEYLRTDIDAPALNDSDLNYRYVTLDRFGVEGSYSGINSRVMILLE